MRTLNLTRGDFFGGLTAGIVALPLALAFGVQAGMGAAFGLYGAIFLGFFAALLGGTPSQISGPTGPMTVVSAAAIADFIAMTGNVESAMGPIVACFIIAGIFQVLMGLLKIGTLIKYIPYPVVSGFMSGIGVIIILLQIFPAVGKKSPRGTVDVITRILEVFADVNMWALLFTVLTILIIYLFPKITRAVPSTLVALLGVTILSIVLDKDVPVIGDIPQGFPAFQTGHIFNIPPELIKEIIEAGLTLAALGSIDSLLTSVVADNLTKTRHSSNRELIGQGIGNAIGGVFAGLPGAGATMRTLVNIRSGGRNRISGVIHALTLLIILLGAGKYASVIPNAVLAGILITVGIGILDYKGFRHIAKVPRTDAIIMVIVLLVTVFLDLLTAVAIGMVMAALLFMKKMSDISQERTKVTRISDFKKEVGWSDEEMPAELEKNVFVKHFDGPLFFGVATNMQSMLDKFRDMKYVILRLEKVPFVDQSGLYALEEFILGLERKGINVLLTGLQDQPRNRMKSINMIPGLITNENIFHSFEECVTWLMKNNNS